MNSERRDESLLDAWRTGDTAAGELLFTRYYHRIERFFLNKVSSQVEDLVQETFMACLQGRDRLRQRKSFRSYLFAIALNVLRKHLRAKYKHRGDIDFESASLFDLTPSPSSMMANRQAKRILLEGLRRIPIDYQILLELYYWEQMQTPQIAELLDLPVSSARRRLGRARELLARTLGELEMSGRSLSETLSQLDDWAEECRRVIHRDPQ